MCKSNFKSLFLEGFFQANVDLFLLQKNHLLYFYRDKNTPESLSLKFEQYLKKKSCDLSKGKSYKGITDVQRMILGGQRSRSQKSAKKMAVSY